VVYVTIISPKLFSHGMFMDGLWYAVLSRNLAEGIGSFWHLKFTETIYKSFYEHPPLAFGLESILFSIFGDSYLVERFYSLLTLIITIFILLQFWNKLTDSNKTAYVPLLFFITIPLVKWCTENNLLENTMSIFTLASVYYQYKALNEKRFFNVFLGGFCILLGILSKGFTGLFVFSFYFWFALFDIKNWKEYVLNTFYILGFFLLSFGLMLLFLPDSQEFLITYFNKQVVGSISNITTVDSRFYILKRCITEELLIPLILFCVTLILNRDQLDEIKKSKELKFGIIFILVALSGVLPIMVSMKQRGFYIMATFPFFALGFGLMTYPLLRKLSLDKISLTLLKTIAILALFTMIFMGVKSSKETRRNKELVNDCKLISEQLPKGSIISAARSLSSEYSLMGYLMRFNKISLDFKNDNACHISKQNSTEDNKKSLKLIPLKTFEYHLFCD